MGHPVFNLLCKVKNSMSNLDRVGVDAPLVEHAENAKKQIKEPGKSGKHQSVLQAKLSKMAMQIGYAGTAIFHL